MKLVIDSNVWISAIVFGGNPRKLLELIAQDGHTIIASEEIFTETRRVLYKKFPDFIEDFEKLSIILEPFTLKVKLGSLSIRASRDPNDDYILETAVIGGAGLIASGDKDLAVIGKYKNVLICSVKSAIELIVHRSK